MKRRYCGSYATIFSSSLHNIIHVNQSIEHLWMCLCNFELIFFLENFTFSLLLLCCPSLHIECGISDDGNALNSHQLNLFSFAFREISIMYFKQKISTIIVEAPSIWQSKMCYLVTGWIVCECNHNVNQKRRRRKEKGENRHTDNLYLSVYFENLSKIYKTFSRLQAYCDRCLFTHVDRHAHALTTTLSPSLSVA